MLRNSRVIRLALGALLLSVPCFAQDIPLDQALRQLQSYRFGQNDKLLNALREYTIRSQGNPSVRGALQEGLVGLLDSQAAYGAKQFACRQLVLIATEKQVPALARHLSDPALSHIVLYVLSHIPGTAVDRALTGALGKAAAREKIGILNTLGNRRSAAAAAAVAAQLGDSDGDVAEEAALALGRIGTTEAAGILRTAFGDKGHPAHDVLPEPAWPVRMHSCGTVRALRPRLYMKLFSRRTFLLLYGPRH